jgi:hypothetical protein
VGVVEGAAVPEATFEEDGEDLEEKQNGSPPP